jgi:hypothetical protein
MKYTAFLLLTFLSRFNGSWIRLRVTKEDVALLSDFPDFKEYSMKLAAERRAVCLEEQCSQIKL